MESQGWYSSCRYLPLTATLITLLFLFLHTPHGKFSRKELIIESLQCRRSLPFKCGQHLPAHFTHHPSTEEHAVLYPQKGSPIPPIILSLVTFGTSLRIRSQIHKLQRAHNFIVLLLLSYHITCTEYFMSGLTVEHTGEWII